MKRLYFYSVMAFAAALSALFGCSTKTDFLPRLDIAFADGSTLSGSSVNCSEEGGGATIRIACNDAWKIGCDASWITFSAREGSGDAEVILSVGAAEGARSAVVAVYMPAFPQMRRSFDVVQRVNPEPDDPDKPDTPDNPDNPDVPQVREATIAELNASMPASEGSVAVDERRDVRFEGVVQNDTRVGNYPSQTLFLADAEASDAGNGLCLVGDTVDPLACGLECGDRVAVTLRAGEAMLVNRGGMRYATGDGEWATVEKRGSGESVARVVADPSRVADYCGMTVTIRAARPTAGGVWCSTTDGLHEFSASGATFGVGVRAAASVFVDKRFDAREGAVTGIVTVCDGRVRIYPRNPADVADFDAEETPDPAPECGWVTSTANLSAGRYYMGGYRNGVLHLAAGGITSAGHGDTVGYESDDDGSISPTGEAAAEVTLEAAAERNGYYIRFGDEGYLTATAAGPGKLELSPDRDRYWIFTDREGGFDVRQAGDIAVKLVISERATSALLRSVAADEEGNPVVLFRLGGND